MTSIFSSSVQNERRDGMHSAATGSLKIHSWEQYGTVKETCNRKKITRVV